METDSCVGWVDGKFKERLSRWLTARERTVRRGMQRLHKLIKALNNMPVADTPRRNTAWAIGLPVLIVLAGSGSCVHAAGIDDNPTQREIYTCENERKQFESWSKLAGTRAEPELLQLPGSSIASVATADGRTLKGMQIRSPAGARDALLVVQGNAWSTKAFSTIAALFPSDKLDIFAFDFRGYGLSKPGNPTMAAILGDYQEIGAWLQTRGYRDLYLYGYSFGGVIALNSFPNGKPFRRIVVDSVPARPSEIGFRCTPSYDPVDKIPAACPHLTFMHGTSDWVVPRKATQALIDAVRACGGELDIEARRGHPFQIEWASSKEARVRAMIQHLKLQGDQ